MIQIAIVEDEEIYVKQLTEYIRKYQTERGRSIKVTVFGDGEDITENYSGGFDIILMDIQMRFMDGMTAAEKIRQMDQKVIIMFITNMIQYAVRGYEVDAMDYVVKPVEYFSFSQKLDKAVGRMRSEVKEFLTIPIGEGVVKIDIADIYYIEGQRHNVIYYTLRGDYCSRITMKELEEKLAVHNFFRCAKGYLVNMNHVEGFVGSDCVIHNVHIPVSRTRKKEFMNLLLQRNLIKKFIGLNIMYTATYLFLAAKGYVAGRVKIGVTYYAVSDTTAEIYGIKPGICIVSINPDCDVANTDLAEGDIITEIDGKSTAGEVDIASLFSGKQAGDEVVCKVYRKTDSGDEKEFEIKFKLMADNGGLVADSQAE